MSNKAATFAPTNANKANANIPVMQREQEYTAPGEAANIDATATNETGDALRVRLGVQVRTFQKNWKKELGYAYDSRKVVTDFEREAMEKRFAAYHDEGTVKRVRTLKVDPELFDVVVNLGQKKAEISPLNIATKPGEVRENFTGSIAKDQAVSAFGWIVDRLKSVSISTESLAAWAMFIVPTIASIRNTVHVSGAFSGDYGTALLITATISGTGILWIMSRKRVGWGDMAGIFVFQLFEAFSNMVQVFKTLMGSMSYALTTVSGTPSELLDMVATVTGSDHRDTAVFLAFGVALFVLAAQIKGLLLIKSQKGK